MGKNCIAVDKNESVDANTWNKILQAVSENPVLKKQMSSAAYLAFLAEERVRAKLAKAYSYADGDIMPPILTPETAKGRNNQLGEMIDKAFTPKIKVNN